MQFDELSPIHYVKTVCDVSTIKIISTACISMFLFLFGENLMPTIIVLTLVIIDTITGVVAAKEEERKGANKVTSKRAWRVVPKLTSVFSVIITANLVSLFEPALGTLPLYLACATIIWVEVKSITENAVRIDPRYDFSKLLDIIQKAISK